MSDEDVDVVEDYGHDVRLVHEERDGEDRYHLDGPMGRIKSFYTPRRRACTPMCTT
jgi:hypothetical protein